MSYIKNDLQVIEEIQVKDTDVRLVLIEWHQRHSRNSGERYTLTHVILYRKTQVILYVRLVLIECRMSIYKSFKGFRWCGTSNRGDEMQAMNHFWITSTTGDYHVCVCVLSCVCVYIHIWRNASHESFLNYRDTRPWSFWMKTSFIIFQ